MINVTEVDGCVLQQTTESQTAVPHLSGRHLDELRRSGLMDETIQDSGCYTETDPNRLRALLHWPESWPVDGGGLVFPFPGTDFVQVKLDNPRLKTDENRPLEVYQVRDWHGGIVDEFVDPDAEEIKYENRRGASARLYIPPMAQHKVNNKKYPLYVVEGAKKALALAQHDFAVVGLVGVWGGGDPEARKVARAGGKDFRKLHPDFDQIPASGRELVVLFDSDIDEKKPVLQAAVTLLKMAEEAGFEPKIAYIDPPEDCEGKMGADDFLVHLEHGPSKMAIQLASAVLSGSARPFNPRRCVTEYLAEDWDDWDGERKERELGRVMKVAQLTISNRLDQDDWKKNTAKVLKMKLKELRELWDRAAGVKPLASSPDWMTAPGYLVAASAEYPGVIKEEKFSVIASEPINIIEGGEDESGNVYLTIKWKYRGEIRTATLRRSEVFGNDLVKLSDQGAPIHQQNKGQIQAFLQWQETSNSDRITRVKVFTEQGWSPDRRTFVLGERVIGAGGRALSTVDDRYADGLRAKGDRRQYMAICAEARAHSPVAELAWAAGYAGPLLDLVDVRSVTFSVWAKTGSGKSAVQALSVSPWGDPEKLKITGDVSPSAVESHLAMRKDTITWIDDTQRTQSDAIFQKLAYQVGSGTGASRSTQTGGLRRTKSWLTLAFVSGERPMLDSGAAGGLQNRTIEIQAAPLPNSDVARDLHQALGEHHGHTGPMYIEALMKRYIEPGKLHELRELYRDFEKELDDDRDEAVSNIALLVLADYLARTLVWGEDEDEARVAALEAGEEVLALVRASTVEVGSTGEAGYEHILGCVAADAPFYGGDNSEPNRVYGRYMSAKEMGRRCVAITPAMFQRYAQQINLTPRQLAAEIRDRGLLITGEGGHIKAKVTIAGSRTRCYCVVLDEDGANGAVPVNLPPHLAEFGKLGHGLTPVPAVPAASAKTPVQADPVEKGEVDAGSRGPVSAVGTGTTGTDIDIEKKNCSSNSISSEINSGGRDLNSPEARAAFLKSFRKSAAE